MDLTGNREVYGNVRHFYVLQGVLSAENRRHFESVYLACFQPHTGLHQSTNHLDG